MLSAIWARLLLVALGGALGSSGRYLTSLAANRLFGPAFPTGTLIVNLAGCLLIGVVFAFSEKAIISPSVRLFLMTGFLGGLTTFSSYAFETVTLFADGSRAFSLTNIALNNVLGLGLALLGVGLGRAI